MVPWDRDNRAGILIPATGARRCCDACADCPRATTPADGTAPVVMRQGGARYRRRHARAGCPRPV